MTLELRQPPGNINVDLVNRIAAVLEGIALSMTKSGASSSARFGGQPRSRRCLSATTNFRQTKQLAARRLPPTKKAQ